MGKKKSIKLSDNDWDMLLPGEHITFGSTSVLIEPLGLLDMASVVKRLSALRSVFAAQGIDLENYGDNASDALLVVLEHCPDILSIASGIDVDDIKRLPFQKSLELLNVVLSVNMKSKEDLLKNLKSLMTLGTALVTKGSETLSSFSSPMDTDGQTSKSTH